MLPVTCCRGARRLGERGLGARGLGARGLGARGLLLDTLCTGVSSWSMPRIVRSVPPRKCFI